MPTKKAYFTKANFSELMVTARLFHEQLPEGHSWDDDAFFRFCQAKDLVSPSMVTDKSAKKKKRATGDDGKKHVLSEFQCHAMTDKWKRCKNAKANQVDADGNPVCFCLAHIKKGFSMTYIEYDDMVAKRRQMVPKKKTKKKTKKKADPPPPAEDLVIEEESSDEESSDEDSS